MRLPARRAAWSKRRRERRACRVLAETVADGRPLAEYEERRRPRVDLVQAQTHRRDRTRNLPSFVLDPVLRRLGQRIFRGNYELLTAAP
jgi:FAD-dependent urate hydroxylase